MTDHDTLIHFVLEKALDAPNALRVKIYRGLAAVCGDPQEEKQLRSLASNLESSERLCREFNFSFLQKTKS